MSRIYQCHDCHHVSAVDPCDFCNSSNVALKQSDPKTETLKIGRRVIEEYPTVYDLQDLTQHRIGYRLAMGFSMLRGGDS